MLLVEHSLHHHQQKHISRMMNGLRVVWFMAAMVCSSIMSTPVEASGRRVVGGRTEIKGVKGNEEVQELGRYCVEEYNSMRGGGGGNGGDGLLRFSEVLEAERQVVAGMKYYLKISAVSVSTGVPYSFDAVVVVKPWLHSKHLLSFAPSSKAASIGRAVDS